MTIDPPTIAINRVKLNCLQHEQHEQHEGQHFATKINQINKSVNIEKIQTHKIERKL